MQCYRWLYERITRVHLNPYKRKCTADKNHPVPYSEKQTCRNKWVKSTTTLGRFAVTRKKCKPWSQNWLLNRSRQHVEWHNLKNHSQQLYAYSEKIKALQKSEPKDGVPRAIIFKTIENTCLNTSIISYELTTGLMYLSHFLLIFQCGSNKQYRRHITPERT